MSDQLQTEIAKRRTFAIISHPDAGKTTLTEKLLLYGGAIHMAGIGQGEPNGSRRHQRLDGAGTPARHLDHHQRAAVHLRRPAHEPAGHARPQRLQRGHLPDAPGGRFGGHADRQRQGHRAADHQAVSGLPDARHSDRHLHQQAGPRGARRRWSCWTRSSACWGIPTTPVNWPVGAGSSFVGVVDRATGQVLKFDRTPSGTMQAPMSAITLDDELVRDDAGRARLRRAAGRGGAARGRHARVRSATSSWPDSSRRCSSAAR